MSRMSQPSGAIVKWHPVETAPTDVPVLASFYGRVVIAVRLPLGNWYEQDAICHGTPTHWMPLPAAPSDQDD